MSVELEEVRGFLAGIEPFAHLPQQELEGLPSRMTMRYARRGDIVVKQGEVNSTLYIIRSGAIDIAGDEGILLDRRDAGRTFGYSTLAIGTHPAVPSRYDMIAVEDTLLLCLPAEVVTELAERHPDLARYYSGQSARIKAAAEELRHHSSSEILRTRVSDFMTSAPAHVDSNATIQQAAHTMEQNKVSSLLVMDGGTLVGIVTDRDMRGRVVACALDVNTPVNAIMTPRPLTAAPDTLAFEAMLLMAEHRIHHLPISDGQGGVCGIVATADIMRLLQDDPIYLTADLSQRSTPEELRETYQSAGKVAARFIERGASAEEVTGLLTVAADALAGRLLTLAEEQLGQPPVPYAFVVLGSQGRRGMGLASDQDNAIILGDDYDPSNPQHVDYFSELSQRVCTGLDVAGQVLCPGDMMASNPEWRKTTSEWDRTFHQWITAPEPDALLNAQVFFDMRAIHGDRELAERVHSYAVSTAKNARRFHAHLAALAARREPPLGFFRGLVVERGGDYANTLDVKKGGIAGIVQMARLFALASGSEEVGTRQRLAAAAGDSVSERGASDLTDAFDFLNSIVLRHQATHIRAGQDPDYHIDPQSLGRLDRDHLRDAFRIIKSMQDALATKFPVRNI